MRKFEKISLEQWNRDLGLPQFDYSLPRRGTMLSAGYDFFSIIDFELAPHERKKIPTGVKIQMEADEVCLLMVRSSQGIRYNVRLVNQVGVIDADYYNNRDNEGHVWVMLENEGTECYSVSVGDKICQGIFVKYLLTEDDFTETVREGGIGFTN